MKHLLTEQRIRYAGLTITALSVGLVAWSIYSSDLLQSGAWTEPTALAGIFLSALIFAASLCCNFAAWHLVVMSVSKTQISWLEGYCIYAISQIYKYIPSNVVHHVGRYYMLRRRGVDHAAAAWGFLAETGLSLAASLLVVLAFGAPLIRDVLLSLRNSHLLWVGMIAGGIVLVGAVALLMSYPATIRNALKPFLSRRVLNAGLGALLFHVASRVVAGLGFWWLTVKLLGPGEITLASAIAVWAAGWTIGYVTPGATAGLGVREAALIGALAALNVPITDATLAAIAYRVATTIGDLLFSIVGWICQRFFPVVQSHQAEGMGEP